MARKKTTDKKIPAPLKIFSPALSLHDKENFLDKVVTLSPLFLLGVAPLIFFKMGGEFENNPKMLFLEWGIGLLALIQALRIRQVKAFSWIRTPLDFPLVAFYGLCWLSLLQAANPWQATLNLLHWGAAIIFYFFLVHTLKKQGAIDHIFFVVAVSAIPVSILGILQKLSGVTWGIPQLTVPASTFSNQNMAAQFLAITFPLCMGAVLCSKKFWMKLAAGISIPLSLLYLIYTQARGPWLAALAALVLLIFALFRPPFASKTKTYLRQKKIIYAGIALIVLGILLLMSPARKALQLDEKIKNRFVSIVTEKLNKQGSSQLRYIWWRNTLEMVQDNFFWGVGLGNFKLRYPPYHLSVEKDWSFTEATQLTRVHNDHLQMLAELGFGGFCAYAWIFITFFSMFWKVYKREDDESRLRALCAALGVVAFIVVACFCFPFERAMPPVYLFMLFAIMSFYEGKNSRKIVTLSSPAGHYGARGAVILIIIILLGSSLYFIRKIVLSDKYFVEALESGEKGQIDRANELLKKAKIFSEWNFNITALLARNYTMKGKYQIALDEYMESLRVHPYNVNAFLNIGYCYLNLENYDEAENYFGKFLHIMPDAYKGYNNMGIVYFSKKEYDKAATSYKKAFEIEPSYAEPHFNLGNVYKMQGKLEEAVREYETALALKPDLDDVRQMLVNLYMEAGNLTKAEQALAPLTQKKNTAADACVMLAAIFQKKGEYEKALFQYLKALQFAPREAFIYHNIGFLHYFLKNFEKAEKSLEIAISLDPKLTDSYNLLGQLRMRRQDDAGALELFLKALQINPKLKDVQFNAGMIYLRAGDLDAAVNSYREALKLDPNFSLAHYNLATILRHQGKKDEALLHFEKALENPSELIDIALAKKLIAELKKSKESGQQGIKK